MKSEVLNKMGMKLIGGAQTIARLNKGVARRTEVGDLPEILCISSYPPRECGIATYSQDLLKAMDNKFAHSFSLRVCALESGDSDFNYPEEVKYTLDTTDPVQYADLAQTINQDERIKIVMVQHEFGFFKIEREHDFLQFLYGLIKPVIIVFHTVLPRPDESLKLNVRRIAAACESVIVMTGNSARILKQDYQVSDEKIHVIPHGTHLVPHLSKDLLKHKYGLEGKKVLSTFGLLSSGKGIETTLNALPRIIERNPDVVFLILGKTHPGVVQSEGERYRSMLESRVVELKVQDHVRFVNRYLPLDVLLEYLQLTDIYLFTSKDPNQAVSGTFSYAMSCACPIISTPIPHALEVLHDDTGIIMDFQNAQQLADGVNRLLTDEPLRKAFSSNTLQRIVPTSWENSAIAHAFLIRKTAGRKRPVASTEKVQDPDGLLSSGETDIIELHYRLPEIKLDFLKKLTTDVGIIQFSKINKPDLESGYTLDDNARALITMCMHYEWTKDQDDLNFIRKYLEFIRHCQQDDGSLLNYVDKEQRFTEQNEETNLSDSTGRAIWALGFVISKSRVLPPSLIELADSVMQKIMGRITSMHSTRAMAFSIKGLYYYNLERKDPVVTKLIKELADRLLQMYRHEFGPDWLWYESYLTYANSILPEAMLLAWRETGDAAYKDIAKTSFDYLLSLTFKADRIQVVSNRSWLHKGQVADRHGEQPIDVAYTIMALDEFFKVFKEPRYREQMDSAFNWFLGSNHLHQIIYNPCTGGCFDGLEENHVNLNQGAESTLSYLMARLTMERMNSSKS